MKGPAGYGRYDDDPAHLGCPWAKSDMTPCVARDGAICLSDSVPGRKRVCVGCGQTPDELLKDLATEYAPARKNGPHAPAAAANRMRDLAHEATEPPITVTPADCANPGCLRKVPIAGWFCCSPCESVSPAEPDSLRAGGHPMISHTAKCDHLDDVLTGRAKVAR